MPIRFFCDHCRQMLKIGTSKMGSVVDCPRCHKPVVVPPQSIPQAEQLYQMLKSKHSVEKPPSPPPNNSVQEPISPESAWDDLGNNVNPADLNRWIDELWDADSTNTQDSLSGLFPVPPLVLNPISDAEVALIDIQKRHKLMVTWLWVASSVAFCVGIIFGVIFYAFFVSSPRSLQHIAGNGVERNEIVGTLFFRHENGTRWADVDAVIICLPMGRSIAQQFSLKGLRPGAEDEADNDVVQLIDEMGGMYAKADANGSFTLQYHEGQRYFVVLISANQKRSGEIKPRILQELQPYFRDFSQFGENCKNCLATDEYEWSGGRYAFRHTFEMGE